MGAVRDTACKKLGLDGDANIHLVQLRNGKTIELDDGKANATSLAWSKLMSSVIEDDFAAFHSFALSNGSAEVQLTVAGQAKSASKKTSQFTNKSNEVRY